MKKLSLLVLALLSGSCLAQSTQSLGTQKAVCDLTSEDYAVFAGLLAGLHGPEDPEEAWEGKEILIVDATVTPDRLGTNSNGWGGWGFKSKSSAAPTQETLQDYQKKAQSVCTIVPGFGDPQSYKIISNAEIDRDFHKGHHGWEKFYEKHPKSAGLWRFSRPGYNSAGDEALMYVSHSCGWLCGTGHLYLLSKENGEWTVKNRLMLWIS